MCLVRRFCPGFVDCLTFRFGQWFKNRFYREGWIAGWLNVFFCPLRRFFLFFFLLYIKINRRIAGTDGFIRVGNCQATSMRRKSMYLRHRSIYSGLCFTAVVSSFSSSLCFRASFNGGLYLGKE